jgi:hypothetical protein
MPSKTAVSAVVSIGRIVIYRTRGGVDVPAIVTAVIDGEAGDVHLHPFVPPGVGADAISYQWGVPFEGAEGRTLALDEDGHARVAWRWPERA